VRVWVYRCAGLGVRVCGSGCMGVQVWVYGCERCCMYKRTESWCAWEGAAACGHRKLVHRGGGPPHVHAQSWCARGGGL